MKNENNAYTDLAKHRSQGGSAYLIGTIAGIVVGALFVIAGFILALLGISGSINLVVEAKDITTRLTNASPGVIFAVLGMVVLWRYKPRTNETVRVDSESFTQTTTMFKDDPSVELPSGKRLTIGRPVSIPDAGLANAFSKALSKPIESIGDLDLQSLTGLDANRQNIRDLTGIEECHNLEILSLESNDVSDISRIAHLKALRVLSLNMNPVSDLSPLNTLENLETLFLGKCGISDVSRLSTLKIKKELSIVYNGIADLSPVLNAQFIKPGFKLLVFGNPLSDHSKKSIVAALAERGVEVS